MSASKIGLSIAVQLGLVCVLGTCNTAAASTIISDAFPGSGQDLDGTAPQVDTYDGSDTWHSPASPNNYFRGPTGATMSAGVGYEISTADLAFVPTQGGIYELQATFTLGGGSIGDWLFVGFTDGETDALKSLTEFVGPWMLIRTNAYSDTNPGDNTGDLNLFSNSTDNDQSITGANSGVSGSTETLAVVLDTTTPGGWTATWYENGSQVGSPYQYTSGNPNIGAVSFGNNDTATGTAANFSLTTVPEPTTCAPLAITSAALLMRRRRIGRSA